MNKAPAKYTVSVDLPNVFVFVPLPQVSPYLSLPANIITSDALKTNSISSL